MEIASSSCETRVGKGGIAQVFSYYLYMVVLLPRYYSKVTNTNQLLNWNKKKRTQISKPATST